MRSSVRYRSTTCLTVLWPRPTGNSPSDMDGVSEPTSIEWGMALSEAGRSAAFSCCNPLPPPGEPIGRHSVEWHAASQPDRRSRYFGIDLRPPEQLLQPERLLAAGDRCLRHGRAYAEHARPEG